MSALENAKSNSENSRTTFFRQGAWMVMATMAGGVGMILVHSVVNKSGENAYAQFKALLGMFYLVTAAAGGLWTLFGQQAAAAVSEDHLRRVATAARHVAVGVLGVWGILALVLLARQNALITLWKLDHAGSLWATWALGLVTLWTAIVRGLLQGRQNFPALGWLVMVDGFGRLISVAVIVLTLGGLAAGAMTGAVIGTIGALGIGLWGCRELLRLPTLPGFTWKPWLLGLIPLTFSAGSLQLLQNFDPVFWQSLIPRDGRDLWLVGDRFVPAHTVGFGLTQFTVPLALVMMPRIARSAARGERTDSLKMTVLATGLMGGLAALACTVLPKLPLQIMFFSRPASWAAAPIVPWIAWAMWFFTLANVYLNNLFAQRRFAVVPWLVVLAVAYAGLMTASRERFLSLEPATAYRQGVQFLMLFNASMFAIAAWFSRDPRKPADPIKRLEQAG